jgi:hypothetical protein
MGVPGRQTTLCEREETPETHTVTSEDTIQRRVSRIIFGSSFYLTICGRKPSLKKWFWYWFNEGIISHDTARADFHLINSTIAAKLCGQLAQGDLSLELQMFLIYCSPFHLIVFHTLALRSKRELKGSTRGDKCITGIEDGLQKNQPSIRKLATTHPYKHSCAPRPTLV